MLFRASVARFRCRLSLRLKSMSFCHIRECSFSRCRSASQVAPTTTHRLCLRTCWLSRAMCSGCTAQGIVAMSTDLRSSLPFGPATPCTAAHMWGGVLAGAWVCKHHPHLFCKHAVNTLKRLSCSRCRNRFHKCDMSRDPRLECAGFPSCVRRQWHNSYSVHVDVTAACCSLAVFQTYCNLF